MQEINKKRIPIYCMMILLSLGAFCVSVKMLFTGFSADEEYQLVMSYRLAIGDRLFMEVWDTIQTSGFLCAALIGLYVRLTGATTGVLLYLRACGLLLQLGTAVLFYCTLKKHIKKEYAFLAGISYYCVFTKLIALPDFSNMQMWFLTGLLCMLWNAAEYDRKEQKAKRNMLILCAAIFYCLAVLSTACVILIPIIFGFLWYCFQGKKHNAFQCSLLFWGTCLTAGLLYMGVIVTQGGSLERVLLNMSNTISGDSTHMTGENILGRSKWMSYADDLAVTAVSMALTALAAFLFLRAIRMIHKSRAKSPSFCMVWSVLAMLFTLEKWFIEDTGYDGLKLYIPVLALCGAIVCFKRCRSVQRELALKYAVPLFGVLLFLGAFVNVLLISNVPLTNNLTFLFGAALWGVIALVYYLDSEKNRGSIWVLLTALCLTVIAGTGYTLSSGALGNNIFKLDGIIRNGPAKNCIVSRDVAWVYYTDYNDFENVVKDGSKVLVVTDYFRNTSVTSCYLLKHVKISHYSVNSTPTYSEKLMEYWKLYPERMPDVIMVNTHVVSMKETDWIYQYINGEFGYTECLHAENADYYIR